jgi:hypothetical protein
MRNAKTRVTWESFYNPVRYLPYGLFRRQERLGHVGRGREAGRYSACHRLRTRRALRESKSEMCYRNSTRSIRLILSVLYSSATFHTGYHGGQSKVQQGLCYRPGP